MENTIKTATLTNGSTVPVIHIKRGDMVIMDDVAAMLNITLASLKVRCGNQEVKEIKLTALERKWVQEQGIDARPGLRLLLIDDVSKLLLPSRTTAEMYENYNRLIAVAKGTDPIITFTPPPLTHQLQNPVTPEVVEEVTQVVVETEPVKAEPVELAKILPISNYGKDNAMTVNARELHAALEIPTRFNDWIKRRIEEGMLIEGEDFFSTQERVLNVTRGEDRTEYYFTTEAGKHLAMMAGGPRGKLVRQYFIEVERRYFLERGEPERRPQSIEELILASAQAMFGQKQEIVEIKTTIADRDLDRSLSAEDEAELVKEMETRLQSEGIPACKTVYKDIRNSRGEVIRRETLWGTLHSFKCIIANKLAPMEYRRTFNQNKVPGREWTKFVTYRNVGEVRDMIRTMPFTKTHLKNFKYASDAQGLVWRHEEDAV